MDDHELILAIQEILDGTSWDSGTAAEIATLLVESGYRVRDCDEIDL